MTAHPQVLAGRYEIRETIGRGGMAEVHLGKDTRLGRTIAIKLLRSDIADDPTFQARFRREAQSAAALNHPAIVAVYDSGEEEMVQPDGSTKTVPYIVMEYVEGHTVRELLGEGEAVPITEAIEITTGVLDALEYSHRAGIVHRDIKPGNIMLTSTGAVKVMDFGIARAIEDSSATVTQTQAVVGTAQYLSPEQARGEVVDARSDLYSTGCLLYELLTGQPPFTGDSAVSIAYQHVREIPRPPSALAPDVPEPLDRVTLKSLAKRREDRYQDAAHMRAELLAAGRGAAVGAPATDTWNQPTTVMATAAAVPGSTSPAPAPPSAASGAGTETEEEPERKRRWWLWLLILLLLIAVGTGIGLAASGRIGGSGGASASPSATAVSVPDVAGMSESEARSAIEGVGLTYVRGDDVESDTVAEGKAVSSEPGSGTAALLGTEVTVHFSAGSSTVTVPDVSGRSQDDAKKALEDAGLTVGNATTQDSTTVAKDKVISTDPASGTSVSRGTTVSLVLSTGQTTVPDVTGKSQADARKALEDAGLSVGNVTYGDSTEDKDTVASTDPASGTKVDLDTEVSIVLSNGPSVPDVTGMTESDAKQTLSSSGYTNVEVKTTSVSSESQNGVVVSTSPSVGSSTSTSKTITITIGSYTATTAPTSAATTAATANGNGQGNGGNG
ncbi:Stk1 family PASTA domain-containing Ser/Thr kinase [Actinomyces radicidentis]|uniref:non-specific serine/threonine protein kinase n=1 Tax=Actinomyces radicidentis TaxID=111015 RepID=A0A0X8JDQ9_ACTRD|nr:Stk1 family PASTA domain-containing Ser/Thr kinase [Actinomyces radicidentis]AMD87010.1 serine/threonine protein kinase [Actinomyces radicidentis]